MNHKSGIDMSRATMVYGGGLGFIMLVSLLMSNLPNLALSNYIDIPHRRGLCAALFALGGLAGILGMLRHASRQKAPWAVPQSQVSILYVIFFIASLGGVLLAR